MQASADIDDTKPARAIARATLESVGFPVVEAGTSAIRQAPCRPDTPLTATRPGRTLPVRRPRRRPVGRP